MKQAMSIATSHIAPGRDGDARRARRFRLGTAVTGAFCLLLLVAPCSAQTAPVANTNTDGSGVAQAAPADDRSMTFDTLSVRKEKAVLFIDIAAPPMNLLGPELVRDLVSLMK
jgi:hypothetical protein